MLAFLVAKLLGVCGYPLCRVFGKQRNLSLHLLADFSSFRIMNTLVRITVWAEWGGWYRGPSMNSGSLRGNCRAAEKHEHILAVASLPLQTKAQCLCYGEPCAAIHVPSCLYLSTWKTQRALWSSLWTAVFSLQNWGNRRNSRVSKHISFRHHSYCQLTSSLPEGFFFNKNTLDDICSKPSSLVNKGSFKSKMTLGTIH